MHHGVDDGLGTGAPPVFDVAPVRRSGGGRGLPREVAVALVVGVIAFLGGILVATDRPADRARAVAGPSGPPSASPSTTPTEPPIAALPGSSAFVRGFGPVSLVAALPDGAGCVSSSRQKEVPRTRRDGPRMTFLRSWTIYCPVPVERRQSFLLAVIEGLVRRVPAETYGFSAAIDGAGDALLPYAELPLAGTVALTADAAGPGFSIVIVLEEWLSA